MMMDGMGCMMLMMALGIVIFLGLITGGVYLLVRAIRGGADDSGGKTGEMRAPSNAFAILQERFARGEIDREEFEDRRRVLERP